MGDKEMSWGRSKTTPIPLKRVNKDELLKAISELESRGYELMGEIHEVTDTGSYAKETYDYKYQRHGYGFDNSTFWFAKMRRKS